MTILKKSDGVWRPAWEVTEIGAGFADIDLSLDEITRLNAFLLRFEESRAGRQHCWKREKEKRAKQSYRRLIWSGYGGARKGKRHRD